ncbi:MAG: ferric reductase-like transmembrane domain-containing protein [Candidatus Dormibacteraeota bacterium]|nr:ferric reductase-like transmembrane domain-containing protein [Candidatus Dormibacteraeota bacterium]
MNTTVLWYATRGAGAVTLVLLSAVVILGLLTVLRVEGRAWPRFLTAGLHRNLALASLIFLALHVVTAVVDPYTSLGWLVGFVPFVSPYRTLWLGLGAVASDLMLAIVLTSLLRGFVGRGAWRAIHWLAYASWPVAVVHGLGTGTDSHAAWMLALDLLCVGAVGVALAIRLARTPNPLGASRARAERLARGTVRP